MANNLGPALETLGKGLFEVAKIRTVREENELEHMRRQALQELGLQGQKDLQAASQKHQETMEDTRHAHNLEAGAVEMAARRGDQQAEQAWRSGLEKDKQGFDLKMQGRRESFEMGLHKLRSVEEVRQRTDYQLSQIDRDIKDYRKLMMDADTDPAYAEEIKAYISNLERQREVVFASGAAAEARIMGDKPVAYPGKKPPAEAKPTGGEGAPSPNVAPRPGGPGPSRNGIPEGAYTGGGAPRPVASQVPQGTLFDPLQPSTTDQINARIAGGARDLFGSAGQAMTSGQDPTSQINRQLASRLFGG